MSEKAVILFDLWMTLIYSLPRDPILDLQHIVQHKGESGADKLDPAFAATCLTTDIGDEKAFLAHLAGKHTVLLTGEAQAQFAQLLADERAGVKFYPETLEVLAELKGRGKRLGIVSNLWPFPVQHIFEKLGLGAYFEHMIYSCAEGAAKPSPKIFQAALSRFGVSACDCQMVGDSLTSDIQGALAAGIAPVLINRSGTQMQLPEGVRAIDSLRLLL
jgi:HAD superfamily hydrolase (TIGR01549 family)